LRISNPPDTRKEEETPMKKILSVAVAALLALSLGACTRGKVPAEQALKSAEEALNAVKPEAMKYIPDQVKPVEESLKAAKEAFDKGNYGETTTAAIFATSKAKDLLAATIAKKNELTKAWEEQSRMLPNMIAAIQSRIDDLSKSRKLPANLDREKFERARNDLVEIDKAWGEASSAFKEGGLPDALAKAKSAREKAVEIMTTLGMQVPEAAKG
jgi:flagellar hook-basal body complex protein FliE